MLRRLVERIGNALRPHRADPDLAREIAAHLALLEDEYQRRGMSAAEAHRAACLELGGVEQTKELHRDARSFVWLDETRRDLQYAVRSLRHAPGFAAVAILTLALGIGANTAIFSLIDVLMLRWLPVSNAQELVALWRIQGSQSGGSFSYPQVQRFAEEAEEGEVLSALAGYGEGTVNVGPLDAAEPTEGAWVSGGYYQTLGLVPSVGRLLTLDDDRPGATPAAVISDAYWSRKFNRDAAIIGTPIILEGVPIPVVGVSPPGFDGANVGSPANITLAIAVRPQLQPERASFVGPGARWLRILARPKPGVSREQLQARLAVVWSEGISASLPPTATEQARRQALSSTIEVRDGRLGSSTLRTRFRQPLFALMAVVGLVLAIACGNVANLLLARATVRQREMSIRLAIGAGRGRLIRQLLTESALLALVGALLGVLLASFGSQFLIDLISRTSTEPDQAGIVLDVRADWYAVAFTTGVTALTTLLFGLVPAFRATVVAPIVAMNAQSSRIGRQRGRLNGVLVITQVAISLVLLIAAGLFVRTLQNLRSLDMGFRHQGVLLIGADARRAGHQSDRLHAFNQQMLAFATRLPGVRAASMSAVTPLMGGGMSMPIAVNGRRVAGAIGSGESAEFHFNTVAPRYFEALDTPIVRGRDFSDRDDRDRPPVAIVNEAFVRRHMPDGDPLAQRVSVVGAASDRQVIGVVRDAIYETLRDEPPPTVYVPIAQVAAAPVTLVINADGPLTPIASAIRAEFQPKLAGIPLQIRTLTDQVEKSVAQERMMATLAAIFGALALVLAVVGLYGLLSYTVARRTSEIGVRLALGARRSQVLRLVITDALRMLTLGVAAGIVAGGITLRLVSAMLFGLTSNDPLTMAAAVAVLIIAGLAAGLIPALRASHVDPQVALRVE